jgi:hypothetical protein
MRIKENGLLTRASERQKDRGIENKKKINK